MAGHHQPVTCTLELLCTGSIAHRNPPWNGLFAHCCLHSRKLRVITVVKTLQRWWWKSSNQQGWHPRYVKSSKRNTTQLIWGRLVGSHWTMLPSMTRWWHILKMSWTQLNMNGKLWINVWGMWLGPLAFGITSDTPISVLTGCLTHIGPAGASWYNTLKLASCHVHRPCLNPLQSPHRVITSKQESSTSLAS